MGHAPKISSEAATAAAAVVAALAAGGFVRLYDGPKPETADSVPSNNAHVLSEHALASPACLSVADGVATFDVPADDADARAEGDPSWFRCFKADGVSPVFDGTVGQTGGGFDLEGPVVHIEQHMTVQITGFTYTASKG